MNSREGIMLDMLTFGGVGVLVSAIAGLSLYAKAHGLGVK